MPTRRRSRGTTSPCRVPDLDPGESSSSTRVASTAARPRASARPASAPPACSRSVRRCAETPNRQPLEGPERPRLGISTGQPYRNRTRQFQPRRSAPSAPSITAMKGASACPRSSARPSPNPSAFICRTAKTTTSFPPSPTVLFLRRKLAHQQRCMSEAFQSAGYDVKLVIGEEGHNMKQGAAIYQRPSLAVSARIPEPDRRPDRRHRQARDLRGKVYSIVSAEKPGSRVGRNLPLRRAPHGRTGRQCILRRPAANQIYKSDPDGK